MRCALILVVAVACGVCGVFGSPGLNDASLSLGEQGETTKEKVQGPAILHSTLAVPLCSLFFHQPFSSKAGVCFQRDSPCFTVFVSHQSLTSCTTLERVPVGNLHTTYLHSEQECV